MLMFFYAFLVISILGSSAMDAPMSEDDGEESMPLLGNEDPTLTLGLWARYETLEKDVEPSWSNSKHLDDVIQFGHANRKSTVGSLRTLRIQRALKHEDANQLTEYSVFYWQKESEVTAVLREDVPVDEWPAHLRDTKWIRLPDILGKVSDSFDVLTASLMHFTGEFGSREIFQ